ncbi:MAG: uncharacterized protein KVP18_001746 [Porospora cf. gigantea A]|uniref:uncharacterized protein n=1 Tax=Porospora cf. gigantea A TaxID=2853593 RepID=UPI00355A4477|nr:MAG: hypothetical protein KVP18_001746 [Porospora cf. gigantea A]
MRPFPVQTLLAVAVIISSFATLVQRPQISALVQQISALVQEAPEVRETSLPAKAKKKFRAEPAATIKGRLVGPVPWKQWSDRLPKVSYEDLEWRQPLGRVPFYMYDDEEWDALMNVPFQCVNHEKICAEFMFLHQLRFHPWRVKHIEKAAVVVLPIITSDFSTHGRNLRKKNQEEIKAKFKQIRKMIDPHKPHVVYIGDWVMRDIMGKLDWEPVSDFIIVSEALFSWSHKKLPKSARVFHAGLSTWNAQLLESLPARSQWAISPKEFKTRKYLFNFFGRADSRNRYYLRTLMLSQFSKVNEPSVITLVRSKELRERLHLPPCELKGIDQTDWKGCHVNKRVLNFSEEEYLMRNSKFVLITRGDDGGSQRIHQAGRLGAMLVIIGRATVQEGLPFHCLIPWDSIAYIFPNQEILKDGTALEMVLQRINEESNEEFERRLRLYQLHVPDFVWEVENSRVAENILIEAARRTPPDQLAQSGLSQMDLKCVTGGLDLKFEDWAGVERPDLEMTSTSTTESTVSSVKVPTDSTLTAESINQ